MHPHSNFAFTLMCSLSFLSPVLSIHCNDTQFAWPLTKLNLCCNKCPPGKRMDRRSYTVCDTECVACTPGWYTDTYNLAMNCKNCENCDKPNMEYKSRCNTTHNAVCRCKAGYRYKNRFCKPLVLIPDPTTKPTLPPSTTALKPEALTTTIWASSLPIKDTVWFLVIIALLCAGIALVVVTKIKPFMRWIKSKHGYFLATEIAPVPPCSEDEEVSTPVQEVRGKCDV